MQQGFCLLHGAINFGMDTQDGDAECRIGEGTLQHPAQHFDRVFVAPLFLISGCLCVCGPEWTNAPPIQLTMKPQTWYLAAIGTILINEERASVDIALRELHRAPNPTDIELFVAGERQQQALDLGTCFG